MKKLFFACIVACGMKAAAQGKMPLTEKDLSKVTSYFEISNGKLVGEGGKILEGEIKKCQYLLLGEYHHSFQISQLTQAVIPLLHQAGFRNMALEIGPESVGILKGLAKTPNKLTEKLHAFNTKYHVTLDSAIYTPIPFFSNTEDAAFLEEAAKRNWKLAGLDQEFIISYLPLLERMQNNLDEKRKFRLNEAYREAMEVARNAYRIENAGGKEIQETISESAAFENYLTLSSQNNDANKCIADALRKTTSIYMKSVKKKYLDQNSERVAYMKENLSKFFAGYTFNMKHDKLFLKMGAVHTGKGFSPLSLYEIGNTLHELAAYHGNRSLHININSRFYVDKGREIDELADTTSFGYRFKALFQMAKKDKWTLIDLRPLHYRVFYARIYNLDEVILDIFRCHDLLLIPPLDIEPTLNVTPAQQQKN